MPAVSETIELEGDPRPQVRLDAETHRALGVAAKLRGLSMSELASVILKSHRDIRNARKIVESDRAN